MTRKPFKLKSGNKASFKEMASSPLNAADATLVGAARTAAMANKPGNWSSYYDKAASGQLAASKGLADVIGEVAKGAGTMTEQAVAKKQQAKVDKGNKQGASKEDREKGAKAAKRMDAADRAKRRGEYSDKKKKKEKNNIKTSRKTKSKSSDKKKKNNNTTSLLGDDYVLKGDL